MNDNEKDTELLLAREHSLNLAAPAPRRPRGTVKRCCLYTCGFLFFLIFCAIGYITYTGLKEFYQNLSNPHATRFYNGTSSLDELGSAVVAPLIDQTTQYDIAISVYVRQANDNATEEAKEDEEDLGLDLEQRRKARAETTTARMLKVPVSEVRTWAPEDLLWSGYIARGHSLSSRPIDKTISFDLPLERFYNDPLFARDLRMGVALIPTSPSKLDRLDNFTYWKGDVWGQYQVGLDESLLDTSSKSAIEVDAIRHMVNSFSLLEFHPTVPCNQTNSTDTAAEEEEEDLYGSVQDVKDEERWGNSTEPEKPLGKHPHVVTRSHFYIVNETRLFDRKQYDTVHNDLRKTSCGRAVNNAAPSWMLCHRDYQTNGNFELRLGLLPGQEGRKKGLAYGPHIARLKHSAGPLDVTRLPITRQICNDTDATHSGPKSITITHTIRFSSLSAARVRVLEDFGNGERMAHNATERESMLAHDSWQQHLGVLGDRAEGAHPWRRLMLTVLADVFLDLPDAILIILYWFTRQTSAGINHTATALHGAFWLASRIKSIIHVFHVAGVGPGLFAVIFEGYPIIPCILMLRLVSPWSLHIINWPRIQYTFGRTRWTHRERQSKRVGAGISWLIVLALLLGTLAITYLPHRFGLDLITSRVPPHVGPQENDKWYTARIVSSLLFAPQLTALILQLEHNRSSGTFAGDYALSAYLRLASTMIGFVWWTPFVGRYNARAGLGPDMLLMLAISVGTAWQAWTLPRVEQEVEEVDE